MNALVLTLALMGQVDYDVLFIAAPRDAEFRGPASFSAVSNGPFIYDPRQQLIYRAPDGTERVVAETVMDYCMSLDGQSIYYSQIHTAGKYADIYRVPVAGGEPVRLTDAASEWRPPTGVYPAGSDGPVWNTAPCDTPEGLVFTSSRDNITSPSDPFIAFMLYRMDHDGSNVEKIGHMNLSGVLHPSYFNGRVYFATNETQGHRGGLGNGWAIWSIKPDGTDWQPEFTQAGDIDDGWHISTHTSDGTLVADEYYDTRLVGKILAAPQVSADPHGPQSKFGKPVKSQNPWTWGGWDVGHGRIRSGNFYQYPFQRVGAFNPLPMFHRQDVLNTTGTDPVYYQREVGHPSGGPGNSLLVSWTGDDPAGRSWGIYAVPNIAEARHYPPLDTRPVTDLSDRPLDYFVKVVDEPNRHEWFSRAAVSYQAIYGSPAPAMTPSPVATELPDGTPYGIIGSSNVAWQELLSSDGKKELPKIPLGDIAGIRILHFNPTQAARRFTRIQNNSPWHSARMGYEGFSSSMNERAGFYEQLIPINTDGSFKAALPADQPWTFQLIDHDGFAIPGGTAQTWHQVRPGERRVDCNGCHAHHQPAPEKFEDTIAGQPDYQFVKLAKVRKVIYERDLASIDTHGFGSRVWFSKDSGTPRQYASKLWAAIQTLPDAERRLWAAWTDTGFMAYAGAEIDSGLGPEADTVPPTLVLTTYTDKTLIGAADPDSGVNWDSLSVIHNGNDIASLFIREGDVLTGPPVEGTVTVSIRDNQHATGAEQGNLTSITRRVTPSEPPIEPPNPNQPRIDEINARLAEIAEEIEGLETERAALESELAELESQ